MKNSKPVENTINKGGRPSTLTNRQKEFARYYVEGKYSNAECARMAGYADASARIQAHKFLDGKKIMKLKRKLKLNIFSLN